MTKKICLLLGMLPFTLTVYCQQTATSALYNLVTEKRHGQTVKASYLFEKSNNDVAEIKNNLTMGQALLLDKNKSLLMFKNKPAGISLVVPYGNSQYRLELVQENISSSEVPYGKLTGNHKKEKAGVLNGMHYRGYVYGSLSSYASLSIFDNGEIMCLFANEEGNFNLGKIKGDVYVLFNSAHMPKHPGFECGTDETLAGPGTAINTNKQNSIATPLGGTPPLACNKLRIYWEGDFKLYDFNFSDNFQSTTNYLSGLFNQVATMYRNEGILIELSELYIWVEQDPYNTSSSANGLSTLKTYWNANGDSFNGDFCVLIDGGETNNGGRAYILSNDLCFKFFAYGYTNVYGHYNSVPSYSWDVEVVTHEMGHMMGSHHTHWCGWNTGIGGACGAIDDCNTVEATAACTTCSATTGTNPTAPSGFKGTVMSYCHLRSGIGINLANGFGPLPQAAMRNMVNAAYCAVKNSVWTGASNRAWENILNWNCTTIPDSTSDVTIPSGLTNYPQINTNAVCRKLFQEANSSVEVKPGVKLRVVGKNE